MKKALLILTLCSLILSACVGSLPDLSSDGPTEPSQPPPAATWTAAVPPLSPTATFTTTPTITHTPVPTSTYTPTPEPICNAVDLIAQGYQVDPGNPVAPGSKFTLILRLTNAGDCVWTTDYKLVLIKTTGLITAESQPLAPPALPGQTIDIPIEITAPNTPGTFYANWALQDPLGVNFGFGENHDQMFTQNVAVSGNQPEVITDWWTPKENCVEQQPTSSGLPRYARLMHDGQWMPWPSRLQNPEWPNRNHFDWYPETVQLSIRPKGGDGRFRYPIEWLVFLREIQPNDEAAVWIARVAAGLFNKGNPFVPILNLDELTELPVAESISSGGNVVRILEEFKNAGRLDMFWTKGEPPDPNDYNYQNKPWLITKFTAVSIDGELGNPGDIDVYFPNLAKEEEGYWVDMERVEYFPELPFCAKVRQNLIVRESPSVYSARLGILAPDKQVVVHSYLPQASDVWGRIAGGWVLLVYQEDGAPIYPTTWEMETRPPILIP